MPFADDIALCSKNCGERKHSRRKIGERLKEGDLQIIRNKLSIESFAMKEIHKFDSKGK